ncbi:MAG: MBL fold metallo-hydrolase [Candidatus Latescibacterota bacterium]|nr:MAG: MBL fold metallo-hydrolase [Candidatus Latescibacterota bacterium]
MRAGNWVVEAVLAGRFRLDGGAMFGVVPKTLWSRVAPADDKNRISMAMRTLVIRSEGKTVLIDAGAGRGYGEKLKTIYAFGNFVPLVESLGIGAGDVTDVILTHLHFDHAGGAAIPDGNGWRLAFPNAVHHVQTAQWNHALDPNPRDRASYFADRIKLLEERGALELHDGDWTLAPGFELLVFHGHTPGQHLPKVSGDGQVVFYGGDLIPTTAHIPIPYVMAYDLDPVLTMDEKDRILRAAAAEDWTIVFEHDPDVEACRIEWDGDKYGRGDLVTI